MLQEILKSCKFIISLPVFTKSFFISLFIFPPSSIPLSLQTQLHSTLYLFSLFPSLILYTVSFADFTLHYFVSNIFSLQLYGLAIFHLNLQSHSLPHFLVLVHFPLSVVSLVDEMCRYQITSLQALEPSSTSCLL